LKHNGITQEILYSLHAKGHTFFKNHPYTQKYPVSFAIKLPVSADDYTFCLCATEKHVQRGRKCKPACPYQHANTSAHPSMRINAS